jgi:molybdenum cofactor biosynthesis protein B
MTAREFLPLRIGVLTVSDTRTEADDKSGSLIADTLGRAGHHIVARRIVKDDVEQIRQAFQRWQATESPEVVVVTGGTGITARDVTVEAFAPLVSKEIPGFGELFRWLSYEEIGASTMSGAVLVFALPGSTAAVRLALDRILVPQLDHRTSPCNFAMLLPRL